MELVEIKKIGSKKQNKMATGIKEDSSYTNSNLTNIKYIIVHIPINNNEIMIKNLPLKANHNPEHVLSMTIIQGALVVSIAGFVGNVD